MHRTILTPAERAFAHALGSVLEEQRRTAGLTKTALAARLGVAESTLLRWEDGRMVPHLSLLRRVAVELGTTALVLLFRAERRVTFTPSPAGENG